MILADADTDMMILRAAVDRNSSLVVYKIMVEIAFLSAVLVLLWRVWKMVQKVNSTLDIALQTNQATKKVVRPLAEAASQIVQATEVIRRKTGDSHDSGPPTH